MTVYTATAISSLPIEWSTYNHALTRNQDEIKQLQNEVDRALAHTNAEEQAILNEEFRKAYKIADKKRVLDAARNASARAQRRLDRLQTRVECWDKVKYSPTTPVREMQGRSAMDIFREIQECLEDAKEDLQEVVNVEHNRC